MKILFIADAHLKGMNDPYQNKLSALLNRMAEEIDSLFILGDLFEFWVGDHPILHHQYREILNSIEKVKNLNKRIVYLEGNHDFHLENYFKKKLKAEVFPDAHVESINGMNFYFSHGDLANTSDLKYLLLRTFLRTFLFRNIIKLIPYSIVWKTGMFFASMGQNNWGQPDKKLQEYLRRFAEKIFYENIDNVILAHSHFPETRMVSVNGRKCMYINVGGWKPDMYYLIYDGKNFEHRKYRHE
jgi:UDP-2,3-diacylglucosamine hydrolase